MRKFSRWSGKAWVLPIAGLLVLQGCKDPLENPTQLMEGTWHTYYNPAVTYETDYCYGTLSPMATETWEIIWEVKALNTAEVDINMSWTPTNFIVTDFTCGSSTGIVPEAMPIEHLYGYIDGNYLRISDQDDPYGTKLYYGSLLYKPRTMEGNLTIDSYSGSFIFQSVSIPGLKLEKY